MKKLSSVISPGRFLIILKHRYWRINFYKRRKMALLPAGEANKLCVLMLG